MSTDGKELRVEAYPEKRFFIDMLVKDIELIPALIDLVDNSVDGARRIHGEGELAGQWVRIVASQSDCSVEDNSGGISVALAEKYAFRFGRPADFPEQKRSVGQFGIGMKRALFKLGSSFRVTSIYSEDGIRGTKFSLDVDVEEWAAKTEWKFAFDTAEDPYQLQGDDVAGTLITIGQLHPSISSDLGSLHVVSELTNELRVRHQEAIQAGLEITVNGTRLRGAPPMLQSSEELKPIWREFSVSTDKGTVEVWLAAGTVRARGGGSGIDADEGEAEEFPEPGEAGWYLYCNDRLLVSADRSTLTGWGDPAATYHPQYRLFRGYIYLYADDSSLLPWNTTKTAVDRDSEVFRRVQSEMKKALVEVQAGINLLKRDRKEVQDGGEESALYTAFAQAPEVRVRDLEQSDRFALPPREAGRSRSRTNTQRISYAVDKAAFGEVKAVLGVDAAADVGRRTFEYYVDREIAP